MGPLAGLKVVELSGIGPVPMCSMLLSDMGAEVLRIDRTQESGLGISNERKFDVLQRGRRNVAVDLKKPEGVETVLRLAEQADALLEGFRPGVLERLGLAPDILLERNPKLVIGRMTGWGQDGPIAHAAGHDINYIAIAGSLNAIGSRGGPPVPPLNLVGDFGGGAMFLAFGVVSGMLEAAKSGKGQVVDASMAEGAAYLTSPFFGWQASGFYKEERGSNAIDGGSHFYGVYETKDGKYVSIGSIEAKFYRELLTHVGLDNAELPEQMDRESWQAMRSRLEDIFKTKTRDEWCEVMEGSDICFGPVLAISEAHEHPQNKARNSFVEIEGVIQPAPAPKFSRTKPEVQRPPAGRGQHTEEALADWGFASDEIEALKTAGAVLQG